MTALTRTATGRTNPARRLVVILRLAVLSILQFAVIIAARMVTQYFAVIIPAQPGLLAAAIMFVAQPDFFAVPTRQIAAR